MLVTLSSPKGGSGTSVSAVALASLLADPSALLVDLDGDLPAVCGLPDEDAPGIGDLAAAIDAPPDGLARIERPVGERLALLSRGHGEPAPGRPELLAAVLAADRRLVVVDAGDGSSALARALSARAAHRILVVRPCYLALRRAAVIDDATAVLLIEEPGRALRRGDVADATGLPVTSVPWDPSIARAVDAGLLVSRPPRCLRRPLSGLLG